MEWDSTLLNEDDSLIQSTPTRIDHRISPMKYSRISEGSVKDNGSSSKDTSNKENISISKCEGQKLNVEPVQMKKKRKGGGYNLRKSLAWNRAFFTDEGVLDPLELSMISGTNINSSRERLSTINEDDSLSNDNQSKIDSADLQALEKNLFKEAPTISSNEDTVHLPPKHKSPARAHRATTSMASPKVLPTNGVSRTGSTGVSCPRPLPLSSLKRPANANACQAVTKQSKLPRIPVSKPGNSSTLVTKKIATQGHVKQKQKTQPVVSNQNKRNVMLKCSPKSVKHVQNKPKAGSGSLPVKASASNSKRNVVNSPIPPHSDTQLHPPGGNKVTNTSSKEILDDVGPSVVLPMSECQDGSIKLPASLPHDTSTISITKQHKQFPPVKPSGLRLPSPSLGFFAQPKSSVAHSASKKVVEADIPCVTKPGYLRPPYSPARLLEVVNDITQTVDTVVLRSGSDFQAVSHERVKPNVRKDAVGKFLKFSDEDESSEPMNDKNANCSKLVTSILGCRESRISTGSDRENIEFLPLQNTVKCAKAASRVRNSIKNSLNCQQDLRHVSEEHVDILESSSGEAVLVTRGDEHFREKGGCNKDSQNLSSENLENADFNNPSCMEIELKSSASSSQERCTKLEKSLIEDDELRIEERDLQMTNIISTSRSRSNLNNCSEVGDLNGFSGKSLGLQSPNLINHPHNNHALPTADCVSVEKDSQEYRKEATDTLPGTTLDVTCNHELDRSDEKSQVTVGMQNEWFDMSKMVGEALAGGSLQSLVKVATSVENHHCSVTKNIGFDDICSSGITSSDSHSALSEASRSLVTDDCTTFCGNDVQSRRVNEDDLMVEGPENLTSLGACLDSEIADVNCGSLLAENKLQGKDQNSGLQNIPEADLTVYDSSMIPLEKSNISQVANVRQIDEREKEVTSPNNLLQVEHELVQEPDSNVPVECCISHAEVVSNQLREAASTEKSGEAGFPNLCILAQKVPQVNQSLPPENCLSRGRTVLAEFEKNNVDKGIDAVPQTADAIVGELESSRPVCRTPPPMHVNGDNRDKDNSASYGVHTMPGYAKVDPSYESYRPLNGGQMKHELEHEDLTSSRNRNQGADRLKKSTLLDETKAKVPQDIDSLAEESHNGLGVATCPAKDEDATAAPIKKSQSSSSRNRARIIPPTNAVPFSDEWLAAVEAAGEDILKTKSGAVQNSPTEKSLPEPSPWSPVRRKNNPIGPFDCTKFTNNLPDSQ